MPHDEPINLLDILDELLQISPVSQEARIAELALSDHDRDLLKSCLKHQKASEGFLEITPALARQAMHMLLSGQEGRTAGISDSQAISLKERLSLHEQPGALIGRYKLLEQIGEGGFGVVFMAEQETPVRRKVALKIIKLGMDTKQVVARFEAERQALALMDHPNIAKVLDAGATDTGRPYFVMELVKGVPITTFCNEKKLTTKERLNLFISVCNAVQHAHQKGIIHRDLKPTNVLVTMHDDKAVPKIIDFGVAKATQSRLTEKTLFTEFKQMIGTPVYMSPEQAQLSGLDVDTRSDIYSLGVVLYELLTGATPFDAKELRSAAHDEMRRIIREVDPPNPSTRLSTMANDTLTAVAYQRRCDPRSLRRLLKGELDWIVMKCLEKDRTRRYETANGLSKDIARCLADEAVEASPPSQTYKFRKFARKHRRTLMGTSTFALLLVIAVLISTWEAGWALRAEANLRSSHEVLVESRNQAIASAASERAAQREAVKNLGDMYTDRGLREGSTNGMAALWFANALMVEGDDIERSKANLVRTNNSLTRQWTPVAALENRANLGQVDDIPGTLVLAFDPMDSRYLLASALNAKASDACCLWNVSTEQPVKWPSELGDISTAVWANEGRLLVGDRQGHVAMVSVPNMTVISRWDLGEPVLFVAATTDEKLIAAATGMSLHVWQAKPDARATTRELASEIKYVGFAPENNMLVTSTKDEAQVFKIGPDAISLDQAFPPVPHVYSNRDPPLFLQSGRELLTNMDLGAWDPSSSLKWYDTSTGTESASIRGAMIGNLVTPDGNSFVAVGSSSSRFFDASRHAHEPTSLPGGWTAALSPQEPLLAFGDANHIRFSVLPGSSLNSSIPPQIHVPGGANWLAFSSDGNLLAVLGTDGLIQVWQRPIPQPNSNNPRRQRLPLVNGSSSGAVFSKDGQYVVPSGTMDSLGNVRAIQVYNVWTGSLVGKRIELQATLLSACFSPDCHLIATATGIKEDIKQIRLWNWQEGIEVCPPFTVPTEPLTVAFAPDGGVVAVHCIDGHVFLVDSGSGRSLMDRQCGDQSGHNAFTGREGTVMFSRDESLFYTAGSSVVEAWDRTTGQVRFSVKHNGVCRAIAESPDGHILASGGTDHWLHLNDTTTGTELLTMAHPGVISEVDFSPDGRNVCTCCGDDQVRVWELKTGRLLFALSVSGKLADAGFTPDGRWIVTANSDGCQMWDAQTGFELFPVLHILNNTCHEHISFSADNHWVVIAGSIERPDWNPPILDLRTLFAADQRTPEESLLWSEILSHSRIDGAALVSLTSAEWLKRWHQYRTQHPQSLLAGDAAEASRLYWLANARLKQGKFDEAENSARQALVIRQKFLSSSEGDWRASVEQVSRLSQQQGKWIGAAIVREDALDSAKTKLEPNNRSNFIEMNNLAWAYYNAGQYDLGLPLAESAVREQTARFGRDDGDTISTLDTLACLYEATGRHDQAIASFEAILNLVKSRGGPTDSGTEYSMNRLAIAYLHAGRLADAQVLFDQTLSLRKSKLPTDDRGFFETLSGLGETLLLEGKYSEAEPLLRNALAICKRDIPDQWDEFNDCSRFTTQSLLGSVLAAQKNMTEAEPLLVSGSKGSLENESRLSVPVRGRLNEAIERLAQFYDTSGKPDQAAEWRAKCTTNSPGSAIYTSRGLAQPAPEKIAP